MSGASTPVNTAGQQAAMDFPSEASAQAAAATVQRQAQIANFSLATQLPPAAKPGPAPGPQGGRKRRTRRKRSTRRNKNKRKTRRF
jgi:hypothetical protein